MRVMLPRNLALMLVITGLFAASPAFADKPEGVGGDKHGGKPQEWRKQEAKGHDKGGKKQADERRNEKGRKYFDDRHRSVVHEYYVESYRAGRCPPGLAKKNNGCLPPGQAKKWIVGRPLPQGVVTYDLPPQVVVSLGVPPSGHRYVRVASDILLIAIGTGLVVDAIQDLGGL